MATKKQYSQAKQDYLYMVEKYGEPSDLTGGFVGFVELLKNPTITNAYYDYVSLIQYGFSMKSGYIWCSEGTEGRDDNYTDISDDIEAVRIYDEYYY